MTSGVQQNTCSYDVECGDVTCDVRSQYCLEGSCYMCSGTCDTSRIEGSHDHSNCMEICGVYMERRCTPTTTTTTTTTTAATMTTGTYSTDCGMSYTNEIILLPVLGIIIALLVISLILVIYCFRKQIRSLKEKARVAETTRDEVTAPANSAHNGDIHVNYTQQNNLSIIGLTEDEPLLQQDGMRASAHDTRRRAEPPAPTGNKDAGNHYDPASTDLRKGSTRYDNPTGGGLHHGSARYDEDPGIDRPNSKTKTAGAPEDLAMQPNHIEKASEETQPKFVSDIPALPAARSRTPPNKRYSTGSCTPVEVQSDSAASSIRNLNLTEHDYPGHISREDIPTNVAQQPVSACNTTTRGSPEQHPARTNHNSTTRGSPVEHPASGSNTTNNVVQHQANDHITSHGSVVQQPVISTPAQPASDPIHDSHHGNQPTSTSGSRHDNQLARPHRYNATSMEQHAGAKMTTGAAKNDSGIATAGSLSAIQTEE